jgi:hypothetical protein
VPAGQMHALPHVLLELAQPSGATCAITADGTWFSRLLGEFHALGQRYKKPTVAGAHTGAGVPQLAVALTQRISAGVPETVHCQGHHHS